MKKVLKNTKGFTLVELLAVIVVLAVIILIAMPSVMSAMEKARRNALITEAAEITKVAQTAYADDIMNNVATGNQSGTCYPLKWLVSNGFLDKNTTNYTGSVLLTVDTNGKATYKIWLSNGMFAIPGVISNEITNTSLTNSKSVSDECNGEASVVRK